MIAAPIARRALLFAGAGGVMLPVFEAVAAVRTHKILIESMKFGAAPIDLRVGDRIIWENRDIFRHTATARDQSFDVDMAPKAEGRVTLARPGSVEVYCRFHPGMGLTLFVKP